ncbi:hypothetical protein Rsub_06406 [Raphidocelis subcapitata]|uniref:Pherophorin domain-containing protein n=1 Tax=Raphidocelis subcapitata TaxID=307507 RepID=A0A2V0P0H2_9CHLO|nr:hypothetical protein Rsub_06406 [Raphidocelis subcapitata]|eukprot:GBF93368.1 hypothetical protein Rsub_06406 [Raphidocelis subcapitata]
MRAPAKAAAAAAAALLALAALLPAARAQAPPPLADAYLATPAADNADGGDGGGGGDGGPAGPAQNSTGQLPGIGADNTALRVKELPLFGSTKCKLYTMAEFTSYRMAYENQTGCFDVVPDAACDRRVGNDCCFFGLDEAPRRLRRLVIETPAGSPCAVKKQKQLGGYGSAVALNIRSFGDFQGSVCVDFSGSTDTGCRSLTDLCGSAGTCNYRIETGSIFIPFFGGLFGGNKPPCCIFGSAPFQ